jgi:hypothetical protein
MSKILTFSTKRGRPGIMYKGFKYRRDRVLGSGRIAWRCLFKSCSTTIRTNAEVNRVISVHGEHSHSSPLLTDVIPTSSREAESPESSSCGPDGSCSSDCFLTSTPLPLVSSVLERENTILRERNAVLEEQWNAAVDRSIMLDKRIMEMGENRIDTATQTNFNSSKLLPSVLYEGIKRFLKDEWLTDDDIGHFLNYMRQCYKNFHALDPSVVSFILNDKSLDLSFLKRHLLEKNIIAFIVNNYNASLINNSGGSHWSLLVYDSIDEKFYNFDSIQGCNDGSTKTLIDRLRSIFETKEVYHVSCLQQSNNYDCGIHTLANLELLLKYRSKHEIKSVSEFDFSNISFDAIKFRWRLFKIISNTLNPDNTVSAPTTNSCSDSPAVLPTEIQTIDPQPTINKNRIPVHSTPSVGKTINSRNYGKLPSHERHSNNKNNGNNDSSITVLQVKFPNSTVE